EGAVFAFDGLMGNILWRWDGTANVGNAGNTLGTPLAAGDFNHDGVNDILVTFNMSIVRVYSGSDGSLIREFNPQNAGNGFAGFSLAVGDVNQDGNLDLLSGSITDYSPNATFPQPNQGNGSLHILSALPPAGCQTAVDAVPLIYDALGSLVPSGNP